MIYEFICHECRLTWDKDGKISKPPKKSKCPKCKKLREKSIHAPAFHMKGLIHKAKEGDVKNFYNEAIKDSKEYLANQKSPYSKWVPNPDVLLKTGQIRRVTDREADNIERGAKDLAQRIKNDTKLSDAEKAKQKSRGNGQFRF